MIRDTEKLTVYIVDDDELMAMMLEDHLRQIHITSIVTFSTGEEFLGNLSTLPDLIILDYNLNSVDPDAANGFQILQAIRDRDENVPVIMYSSQEYFGEEIEMMKKRSVAMLVKDDQMFSRLDDILKNMVGIS